MQLNIALVPVVLALMLTGCQTTKDGTTGSTGSTKDKKVVVSQSDRLTKLAADIEARGESDTAMTLYARAASMPDASPETLVKIGGAQMRAGYPTEAAKMYQAALAKSPNNGPALMGLGATMIEEGDMEAGIRALAQAAPIVNTGNAYNQLGVAQTMAGQVDAAQTTYAQALKLQPGDVDIETNMALAAALNGDSSTALQYAQKVATAPGVQLHHKRNMVLIHGIVGQGDQIRSVPPVGLSTEEIGTLLAHANKIRAKRTVQAKAKALGSMTG